MGIRWKCSGYKDTAIAFENRIHDGGYSQTARNFDSGKKPIKDPFEYDRIFYRLYVTNKFGPSSDRRDSFALFSGGREKGGDV